MMPSTLTGWPPDSRLFLPVRGIPGELIAYYSAA